jgi:DNA-binding NarL/FixJ family response regulator
MHQASPNTINILMVDASVLIYKGLQWILNENFKNAKVFFSVNEKTTLEILNTISIDLIIVERDISMDYLNLISSKIRSKQLNAKIALLTSIKQKVSELQKIYLDKVQLFISQDVSEGEFLNSLMALLRQTVNFDFIKEINVVDYEVISNPITRLSKREFEIAVYMKNGMGNLEISNLLNIGASTVSTYKNRIFEKLGIQNLVQLVDIMRKFESLN